MVRNLIAFAFAPLAVAQIQFQFATPGVTGFAPSNATSYKHILLLRNSDTLFVGSSMVSSATGLYTFPIPHAKIALAAVGPVMVQNGEPPDVLPVLGGSGNDIPEAAAVDSSGNIWIAGSTDSDDFNLVNPIVSQKVPYRTAGFVLELDPTGTKLLFSTYLAGQQRSNVTCPVCRYASSVTTMAIDGGGNVYLGGSTNETDFPTTPGAFMTKGGLVGADNFGNTFFYSFVVKISPAGKLVFSTLLGTGSSSCIGASGCIGDKSTSATVSSIAVNSTGAPTVAGVKGGSFNVGSGYVGRLSANGSQLLWSTSIAPMQAGVSTLFMAQDSAGNVDLFGRYVPTTLEPGLRGPQAGTPGLFAEKLSADGSTVVYSTDLGQTPDANAVGMALDGSGNAYLAGTSSSSQFPILAGVPNLGADFVLALDPPGAKPQALFRFPRGTVSAQPSFDTSGRLQLPGSTGSLLTLPPSYGFNTPAIVGFANAASYAMNTGVTPGELVSLFGFDLDGSPQVLVGGVPAAVLYAGPNQINIQVPLEISPYFGPSQIQVVLSSGSIDLGPVPLARSPGIFTSDGVHAAALNQDGTANSASNPAARGSVVSLFGTGAIWPQGIQDGTIATSLAPLDQETNRFEVVNIAGTPVNILYAGAAPGLIYGVFQVNVQLPPDVLLPLTLRTYQAPTYPTPFGMSVSSNAVQLYLK